MNLVSGKVAKIGPEQNPKEALAVANQTSTPQTHDWNLSLATAAIDRYFLPTDLPPDSASVINVYDQTVCLSNQQQGKGTGVILKDEWLLTCGHVISELAKDSGSYQEIQVKTPFSEFTLANSSIEINDQELDFAIIRCPGLRTKSNIRIGLDASLYLSDRCYLIGNPAYATFGRPVPDKKCGQVISIGKVEESNDTRVHVSGSTINPCYSGGPIVARDGSIIGIISEQFRFGGRGPSMSAIFNKILGL